MNVPEMSLRQWFAGQVISAVVRQCATDLSFYQGSLSAEEYFANKAVEIADALIERTKHE